MKKTVQRLLAAALCAALLFCTALPAGARTFSDVPASNRYFDAINYISDYNIMTGVTESRFAPAGAMTRAMMICALYRKEGSPYVEAVSHPYSDVPAGAYYERALTWAADLGITNGTSATTFSPNRILTREQAMCFLYNYKKAKDEIRESFETERGKKKADQLLSEYSDQNAVARYARPAMAWALKRKIIIITEAGKLLPKYNMSRVQVAYGVSTLCRQEKESPWEDYPEDFSTVYFRLSRGMTITNDQGETLALNMGPGDFFTGNMDIYGWNFFAGLSPVQAHADVPLSRNFKMETPEGVKQSFSVVDKYRYQDIDNFSGTAELCGDGTMNLSGDLEDFTATCFQPETKIKHVLSGSGTQSVRLDFTKEPVVAQGMAGNYTVTTYVGEEEEPASVKEYDKDGRLLSVTEE